MNKSTSNIIFYIFVFFLFILVILGGFFVYKIFIEEKKMFPDVNIGEFEGFLEEDGTKKEGVEYVEYEYNVCLSNKEEYGHRSRKKFFSRNAVGVYESCADFVEEKVCDDGFWIGEDKFKYVKCERSVNCVIDDKTLVKNGNFIELYSKEVIPYGDNCERYKRKRICKETILTGNKNFKYKNCSITKEGTCEVVDNDGVNHILVNGSSRLFFTKKIVEYDDSCSKYVNNRTCVNGQIHGDIEYKYLSCEQEEVKNCFLSKVEIKHGQTKVFYSKLNSEKGKSCLFFAQIRGCINGLLSGRAEYTKTSCSD